LQNYKLLKLKITTNYQTFEFLPESHSERISISLFGLMTLCTYQLRTVE